MIVSLLTASGEQAGKLNVTVSPADATVEVTGPGGYTRTQAGGGTLVDLVPGTYRVTASAAGQSDTTSVGVLAGETAYVSLAPGEAMFAYYLNDYRSPGEAVELVVFQGGSEVPGSRTWKMTTPGYTQIFGAFRLRVGVQATARVQSERLGVREAVFVPVARVGGGSTVGIDIRQDSVGAG